MMIHEVNLNEDVLNQLIRFSEDWAAEDSSYGYRPNDKSDIEGNRIFFAEDGDTVIGHLFGKSNLQAFGFALQRELRAEG